jgi:beta-galactosidase/beta-glucuronidase
MHKNTVSYAPGHPDPLFFRPDWSSLNGAWQLYFDDGNIGLLEGYQNAAPAGSVSIRVPYAYETPLSGIKDEREHNVLWYYKSFRKPTWGKRVLAHFERCDYVFDGWLNGQYLGKHIGGYDAFVFDLTDFLKEGDNLLAVRVYDDKDPKHLRGKQTWKDKPFGVFYPTTTGLYGDVWLESVDAERLKGFDARGSYEEKAVFFRMLFTHKARGATVFVKIRFGGKEAASAVYLITGTFLDVEIKLPPKQFHPWSPARPSLYDLEFDVMRDGTVSDRVYSYLGLNEVSQKKRYLSINGRKRYLKLALYQGYNPQGGLTFTEEQYLKDISLLKAMGFNGVRVHEKVESELFYYLADREGLFTDVEMPSSYEYDPIEAKKAGDQFGILVRDHVSHPSVVAYVAYNESWGLPSINSDLEQQAQASALYDMANRIDWTRPVISNDGFEHTKSDLLTLHNYAHDGKALQAFYKPVMLGIANNANFVANEAKAAFAEGWHYNGQPLLMSEFFGAGLGAGQGGYGANSRTGRGYLVRYRGLLKALKKLGCAGYCATQFADTYQEKNGFVTENRQPKVPPTALKRANKAF